MPPPTDEDVRERARAALKHAASPGVTTIQDMTAGAAELRAYQALRATGELTARIYSIRNYNGPLSDTESASTGERGLQGDWIRIGGIKLFADGSMGSGTAVFFEPYADDPSTSGLSKDLFSIPPREILTTTPVMTIVGGRIVYER